MQCAKFESSVEDVNQNKCKNIKINNFSCFQKSYFYFKILKSTTKIGKIHISIIQYKILN